MSEPTAPCPWCGKACYADWVDVGFGPYGVQCGPYYCEDCNASQIGPYDKKRELTHEEKKYGWYAPGSPLGSSVNAVGGVLISAGLALQLYKLEVASGTKVLDEKTLGNESEEEKYDDDDEVW